jgi:hypothetical protein
MSFQPELMRMSGGKRRTPLLDLFARLLPRRRTAGLAADPPLFPRCYVAVFAAVISLLFHPGSDQKTFEINRIQKYKRPERRKNSE